MKITNIPKYTEVIVICNGYFDSKENLKYTENNPGDRRALLIHDDTPTVDFTKQLCNISEVVYVPNLKDLLVKHNFEFHEFVNLCCRSFCSEVTRVELIG